MGGSRTSCAVWYSGGSEILYWIGQHPTSQGITNKVAGNVGINQFRGFRRQVPWGRFVCAYLKVVDVIDLNSVV